MADKKQALWFDGIVTFGDYRLPDVIDFSVDMNLLSITHNHGGGHGEVSWPTGRNVTGVINFNAINAELMAALTGGALTTGNVKMIREGAETATITTNTITLAQEEKAIQASLKIVGGGGTVFKRVSSAPAAGEYTYAPLTGVCTFAAAETETTVYPEYLYTSSATGQTLTIGKNDVPSEVALYGSLRTKDLNSPSGAVGDVVVYLAKVNVKDTLSLGGDSGGSTKGITVNYSAIMATEGNFKMYFPA